MRLRPNRVPRARRWALAGLIALLGGCHARPPDPWAQAARDRSFRDGTREYAHSMQDSIDLERQADRASKGGDLDEARLLYELAIQRNEHNAAAHDGLARLWARGGRMDDAIREHERALAIEPDDAALHGSAGRTFLEAGNASRAAAELRRAAALAPTSAELQLEIARADAALGNVEAARNEARAAVALAPAERAIQSSGGLLLLDLGDVEAATRALVRAIELDARDATAHHALGRIAQMRHDDAAALAEFREAARIAPEVGVFEASFGLALKKAGEVAAARRALSKALALDPANRVVADALAGLPPPSDAERLGLEVLNGDATTTAHAANELDLGTDDGALTVTPVQIPIDEPVDDEGSDDG